MQTSPDEEGVISQPRKRLISSFTLQKGALIIPLLSFYLQLVVFVTKTHRFVEYTPNKGFNSLVQAAVDAKRKDDENPNSTVVAETMKLLADISYGYQIKEGSRHTVTNYFIDEKTHAALDSKRFKQLDHVNHSLCELELAKAKIEYKKPIIVGTFILQYAKLQMFELYYNFFTKFYDVNKFEEFEMDKIRCSLLLTRKKLKIVSDLK